MLCYMDTRPKGSKGVFAAEVLNHDTIRLKDVDTRQTFLCPGHDFRRHFEPLRW